MNNIPGTSRFTHSGYRKPDVVSVIPHLVPQQRGMMEWCQNNLHV